jgi:hypothetical protein
LWRWLLVGAWLLAIAYFSGQPFAEQCSTLPHWAGVIAAVTWRPLFEALLPVLVRSFIPPAYGPDENRSFGVENLVEDADVPDTQPVVVLFEADTAWRSRIFSQPFQGAPHFLSLCWC